MRLSHLSMFAAVLAFGVVPAMVQNTANTTQQAQPSKQRTQGLPPSMNSPHYGGAFMAQKQHTQGVPPSLSDPHLGGAYTAQKQQ